MNGVHDTSFRVACGGVMESCGVTCGVCTRGAAAARDGALTCNDRIYFFIFYIFFL